jgi:hypothetical protein
VLLHIRYLRHCSNRPKPPPNPSMILAFQTRRPRYPPWASGSRPGIWNPTLPPAIRHSGRQRQTSKLPDHVTHRFYSTTRPFLGHLPVTIHAWPQVAFYLPSPHISSFTCTRNSRAIKFERQIRWRHGLGKGQAGRATSTGWSR